MKVALVGNQNSGKTTLFNDLTGSNQRVGNFPGVTVDKKSGFLKGDDSIEIIDLPGIYSLSSYSEEEIVTRDVVLDNDIDLILNIVDATNIERNLYLSIQLLELNKPMVIALNKTDILEKNNAHIDVELLAKLLDITIIPISAYTKVGIDQLINEIKLLIKNHKMHSTPNYFGENESVESIKQILSKYVEKNLNQFYLAKILENDTMVIDHIGFSNSDKHEIESLRNNLEKQTGIDSLAFLVDKRYDYIDDVVTKVLTKTILKTKEKIVTEKIDNILTNKYFGIPIFIFIMFIIFYLTFNVIGVPLQDLVDNIFGQLIEQVRTFMQTNGWSQWLEGLIADGILSGVGGVLSFLPIIALLFFFLYFLEGSGYMARVAYLLDRLLQKIGLSGQSVVPLILGFGCSVPALMATRTLASERDRKMTMTIIPFMSCSAKIPIYGMIAAAFFPTHAAFVMVGIYILGIVTAIIVSFILSKTLYRGKSIPFVMELPNYHFPKLSTVLLQVWDKAKFFVLKTFTIILMGSVIIWFLQTISIYGNIVENSADSLLANISNFIAPIFAPLGFGNWEAISAIITGVTAKETVVSTLEVLANGVNLNTFVQSIFTPASALSFVTFSALYFPCFATFATLRKELGSLKESFLLVTFQTVVAYIMAFIVYHIAILLV